MLKFYIETVIIYFVIFVISGLLLKKHFIKARNKVRKELDDKRKIDGYFKTTITYLFISFIPVFRFAILYGKFYMTFFTDDFIKRAKENKNVHK